MPLMIVHNFGMKYTCKFLENILHIWFFFITWFNIKKIKHLQMKIPYFNILKSFLI